MWFLGSWSSSVSIVSDYRLSLQLMSLLHSGGKSLNYYIRVHVKETFQLLFTMVGV
jgi:hypothetical protein